MSDYLFDKEGDPDPEVERLERVLAPLAYRGVAPRLPQRRARRGYVVAATLSAIAAAMLLALLFARPWHRAATGWAATVRDGAASRDGHAITGATQLPVGAWLESGSAHVRLSSPTSAPSSFRRARARASSPPGRRGTSCSSTTASLVAAIDAPPRHFVVVTPRAVVTDLGCAFELSVDEAGRGRLVVTGGKRGRLRRRRARDRGAGGGGRRSVGARSGHALRAGRAAAGDAADAADSAHACDGAAPSVEAFATCHARAGRSARETWRAQDPSRRVAPRPHATAAQERDVAAEIRPRFTQGARALRRVAARV